MQFLFKFHRFALKNKMLLHKNVMAETRNLVFDGFMLLYRNFDDKVLMYMTVGIKKKTVILNYLQAALFEIICLDFFLSLSLEMIIKSATHLDMFFHGLISTVKLCRGHSYHFSVCITKCIIIHCFCL